MSYKTAVNVPPVRSIEAAVRLYYEKQEIVTADIMDLFGVSRTKAQRLKRRAEEQQQADGVPHWDARAVNTGCAFASWGLDVGKMEYSLRALRRLKLAE